MNDSRIIKILVSCPEDVSFEKNEIIRLCNAFSEANHGKTNIAFHVLDWKSHVGEIGIRPQQQLNEYFGKYDVYIGVLWKRFGTKPGSENHFGKENESGTEEEFYNVINLKENHEWPKVYFFFKTNDRTANDLKEIDQLNKVFSFIKQLKELNSNYLNFFDSNDLFNSKIIKLLKEIEYSAIHSHSLVEKQSLITANIKIKITDFNTKTIKIPDTYIKRNTSHFKLIKNRRNNLLYQPEQNSLEELLMSTKRVVLLGDAGSGKSTELNHLYYRLTKPNSPFIPILQKLTSYTPDLGLEGFLPDFWKEVSKDILLIIWDGLDEIEPKYFNTVIRQINTFSEKYNEIRILISCRTNFYELPINDSLGTLPVFEPYFIKDLSLNDVKEYYDRKYSDSKSNNFISQIFDNNLNDLITKPFFLMLLADQFNQDQRLLLNRAELFEMFLFRRIELDQNHFKTTVDLRSKKQEILILLQNVALSMEILSKNQIKESEILSLITSKEFSSLKYCTAFKKKDGEKEVWMFEHNNIQEFLAAKALSNIEFEKVVQFIAFAPNYNKLIPSWVNTLAFLFSIVKSKSELFNKLLQWILKYEKEIIVKFEPEKIDEDLKFDIFKGIFNYYKAHDVWISSNKFSDRELARFGQSDQILQFLVKEIKNENNTRTVKLNSIHLIGHFQFKNNDIKIDIEKLLFDQIDLGINDPRFIHEVIYALKQAGFTEANTIEKLMNKVGIQNNQYVRSAMYSILLISDVIDDYVDYLIRGFDLKYKKINHARDEVSLINEDLNFKECVKIIKSPVGIKKIINYVLEISRFESGFDAIEVIDAIISNAIKAYEIDSSVYNSVLNWFKKDIIGFNFNSNNVLLQFFNTTNTREKAFYEMWVLKNDNNSNTNLLTIAKLLTPNLINFVVDEYLNNKLSRKELEEIYSNMRFVNNENIKHLDKLINEKTDFEIKSPKKVDYETLRKEKLNDDFNLLFSQKIFKETVLSIFENEGKDLLSFEELYEIRKENNKWMNIEEKYPIDSLGLLRAFVKRGEFVSKEKVENWFKEDGNEEFYRISHIYEYLIRHKNLEINPEKRAWLEGWCISNVSKINFKEALQIDTDGRVIMKTMAMYIFYFSKRFKINYDKYTFLDMLSFDFFAGNEYVGIEYIISKLDHNDIVVRMLENIEKGIIESTVLNNHIKYLAGNNVKDSYKFILHEIVNLKKRDYERKEFLDLFFEYTKDTEIIKSIIDKGDPMIKWAIIEKLKSNNQELFVEEYLLKFLETSKNNEDIGKAAEILVSLQNMQGLKTYVRLFKSNLVNVIDYSRVSCLTKLKNIDAVPYLIELLEISYLREITINQFENFTFHVLGAFNNIALESEENFIKIKACLLEFIKNKTTLYENVKYILHNIERMEDRFYLNNSQTFTINQVKEKLKLINLQ